MVAALIYLTFFFPFLQTLAESLDRPLRLSIPEYVINMLYGEDRAVLLLAGAKIQPQRMMDLHYDYNYPTIRSALHEIIYPDNVVTATTFKKPTMPSEDIKHNL